MIADANVSPKFPRYKINFVSKLFCTNKKPREDICISVFHLAKLVTKSVFVECKKKSLRPDTIISLSTIINAGYTKTSLIRLLAIRIISIETTKILSAIGSKNLPKFDSISNFLAR